MVILIGGPNQYLCDEKLKSVIGEQDHLSIDLSEHDNFTQLEQAVRGVSLFGSNDLIIVRGAENISKDDTEKLVSLAEETSKETALVIFIPGAGKSITNKYSKVADTTYFENELKPYELIDWVVKYVQGSGGEIDKATARQLIDWSGDNQLMLSNELSKLLSASKHITKDTVEDVASKTPQATIFQLLDAMAQGNTDAALAHYQDLLAQKLEPHYIVSMICWQANVMVVAYSAKGKDLEKAAKEAGVSPFVLRKVSGVVSRLNKAKLISINEQILNLDEQIKNAPVDVERSVEQLIRRLSTSW